MNQFLFILLLSLSLPFCAAGAETFRVPIKGAGDCRAEIQQAIQSATEAGAGSRVQLEKGDYHVWAPQGARWALSVGNAQGLTLVGKGAKTRIVFHTPSAGGIFVTGGEKIRIADLTIDYDPVPFTQGTITATNPQAGWFEMRLDGGYPLLSEPWFQITPTFTPWGLVFDPHERRLKKGVSDFFFMSKWESEPDGIWRIEAKEEEKSKVAGMQAGDRFAFMARPGEGAFLFSNCRDSRLENVTINASPSLSIALIACDGMLIKGVKVTYPPNSARLLASNGDGIHCQRNRKGPEIVGCLFEGLADDGVNIYTPPMVVRQVMSPTRLVVTKGSDLQKGDRLQVFDPVKGIIRAEVQAVAVRDLPDAYEIDLSAPVEGVRAGQTHRDADTIYNLSASGEGYFIHKNRFLEHRRHGVLLRGGKGRIERNLFRGNGGFGIVIGNEPEWPEGPVPGHIAIRHNKLIGGGYSAGYGDSPIGAAIMVRGSGLAGLPATPVVQDIVIEDNKIVSPPGAGIYLGSVKGALVKGNSIEPKGTLPLKTENSILE